MGVGMVMYLWLWIWYGYGLYLAISYGYGTTRTRARKPPGKTTKSWYFITLENWRPNSTKNAKCALSKVRFEPTGVDKRHFAYKNRAILPALSRGVCDLRRRKNAAIPAIPPMPDATGTAPTAAPSTMGEQKHGAANCRLVCSVQAHSCACKRASRFEWCKVKHYAKRGASLLASCKWDM